MEHGCLYFFNKSTPKKEAPFNTIRKTGCLFLNLFSNSEAIPAILLSISSLRIKGTKDLS